MRVFVITLLMMTAVTSATIAAEERRGPPPPPHGERRGPPPELTEEQRACLDEKLGKPGEGERPSHEEMDAALEACVEKVPAD